MMALLRTQIQKRYYYKPTNNNLRITSAPTIQNKRLNYLPQNEVMLLIAKEKRGQELIANENDFIVDINDEGEQIEENVVFMERLEKMKAFEAEHVGVTKDSVNDSQLIEDLTNKVHYETKCYSDSNQDRLIHGSTSIFCYIAHIDTSSLDPTCNKSKEHNESIDPDHSTMLEIYELL
ncbi:hypothetical protein Tco_0382003 [Tanacetum coccineum]